MPRKSHGEKRIDGSISGLSNALEEHQKLRRRALKTGSFLTWPTPEQKGVMNFENLALNHEVIEILIRLWAPQWAEPIMIPVDNLKNEATWGAQSSPKKCDIQKNLLFEDPGWEISEKMKYRNFHHFRDFGFFTPFGRPFRCSDQSRPE